MTSRANLDAFGDRSRPLADRFEPLFAFQQAAGAVARRYLDAIAHGEKLAYEAQAMLGLLIHASAIGWTLIDELLPTLDRNDATFATRMAGLDRARNGTGEQVVGSVEMGPAFEPFLVDFWNDIALDWAALFHRLGRPAQRMVLARALALERRATEPLRSAVARARTAIASSPPADVIVTPVDIRDASHVILTLPSDQAQNGAEAVNKRNGRNDLFLVPLAAAVSKRDVARISVDPSTPFRVLVEVLFTLGQSDIGRFELRTDERRVAVTLPKRAREGLSLTLLVVHDGISVKAKGGNVAPGCDDAGPGLAIVGRDFDALGRCIAKLKSLAPTTRDVVITAAPDVRWEEMLAAIDAASGPNLELFPDVMFGVPK